MTLTLLQLLNPLLVDSGLVECRQVSAIFWHLWRLRMWHDLLILDLVLDLINLLLVHLIVHRGLVLLRRAVGCHRILCLLTVLLILVWTVYLIRLLGHRLAVALVGRRVLCRDAASFAIIRCRSLLGRGICLPLDMSSRVNRGTLGCLWCRLRHLLLLGVGVLIRLSWQLVCRRATRVNRSTIFLRRMNGRLVLNVIRVLHFLF